MSLQPPSEPIEDPGAHELAGESSDDHFSDASEGQGQRNRSTSTASIPVTRVEKVDDKPSHGEVPGTQAYNIRTQDAVPDEIEIVPDGSRSRSTSRLSESDRPLTPGGTPIPIIPKTVVEKVDPSVQGYGDVPGTAAHHMRLADAQPDVVVQAPDTTTAPLEPSPTPNDRSRSPSPSSLHQPQPPLTDELQGEENADDFDDFANGDDFDEFEEGDHVQGDDDDFGDFDDTPVAAAVPVPSPPVSHPLAHLPNLHFADLQTSDDILKAISPYMSGIFPELCTPTSNPTSDTATAAFPTEPILTDRSASLWSQLVAPPPLQPPNWIRSRIRRLFLVSLGVPVDLDEILPASKQKKLVLPNIHLTSGNDAADASKSQKQKQESSRKGPPPPPPFDANAATLVASTTDTALEAYTDDELKAHVVRLEALITDASAVLEYWVRRKESAVGDKEAFEGVIENLVGFVKSRR